MRFFYWSSEILLIIEATTSFVQRVTLDKIYIIGNAACEIDSNNNIFVKIERNYYELLDNDLTFNLGSKNFTIKNFDFL